MQIMQRQHDFDEIAYNYDVLLFMKFNMRQSRVIFRIYEKARKMSLKTAFSFNFCKVMLTSKKLITTPTLFFPGHISLKTQVFTQIQIYFTG